MIANKVGCYVIVTCISMVGARLLVFAEETTAIRFDVPEMVVAEPVDPRMVTQPRMGGKLVRLRIPISVLRETSYGGAVVEYVVEFESPQQTMRMVDFWPRTELYSPIEGNVSVEKSGQSDSDFDLKISGGMEPFVRGSLAGNQHTKTLTQERYERRPPMQTLTSSGTIRRGYGVFFKFRPGPSPELEGLREVAVLAEVPQNWRADALLANLSAVVAGSSSGSRNRLLGRSRLWMTVHQEGDLAAAAQARRFATQERLLRALAASKQKEVEHKSMPTLWHKVGVALDFVEPRIPDDYLAQIIFGPKNQYFEGDAHRLPIDLRVAILDYWEQRDILMGLALGPAEVATQASWQQASKTQLLDAS